MLKHFVVIRLGLGVYNKTWYESRLGLFEAVTCPSLRAQTNQSFAALIAVDRQIPDSALSRLQQIIADALNFHVVPIDLTNLRQVRHGSWDFVWDCCQDHLLEHYLVTDPFDYVITSILDDDDAWHRDTVEIVHRLFEPEVLRLIADEPKRLTNYRHTGGQVLTFPHGMKWFAHDDVVQPYEYEFLGMSVFVLARFSSGISALSSRHPAWRAMANIAAFGAKRVVVGQAQPMWVYVRHDQAEINWQLPTANDPQAIDRGITGDVGDPVCAAALRADFGIDFAKVGAWRAARNAAQQNRHGGFLAREQLDCFFRIAALNRQIAALERKQRRDGMNEKDEAMALQRQRERFGLIHRLQRQGRELFE
jgi:hypothetical protein